MSDQYRQFRRNFLKTIQLRTLTEEAMMYFLPRFANDLYKTYFEQTLKHMESSLNYVCNTVKTH